MTAEELINQILTRHPGVDHIRIHASRRRYHASAFPKLSHPIAQQRREMALREWAEVGSVTLSDIERAANMPSHPLSRRPAVKRLPMRSKNSGGKSSSPKNGECRLTRGARPRY